MLPLHERPVRVIHSNEIDWDARDEHISLVIRGAVAEEMKHAIDTYMPPEDERKWVQLAMKREARREALHNAIIEKSLTGLVWAAIVGFGYILLEYLKHWKGTP